MTRRRWLAMTMAAAGLAPWRSIAAQGDSEAALERRIGRVIREYERQGFHRTGTSVDRRSGDWLYEEVRRIGLPAERESFGLNRVDPDIGALVAGEHRIDGLPLFDGGFTDRAGVGGRLGPIDSDADIGLVEAAPNTAGAGALGQARQQARHRAIVFVTRGGRPGLCPSNADAFVSPFGPPVLQVSSEASALLAGQAAQRTAVTLITSVKRAPATAFNVTAKISGRNPALLPLLVMTPRSGWYCCASERGGGIACWLELMRILKDRRSEREVVFVASSGHELGHLGIDAFVARRPGIVKNSVGWIHLGANIGAATLPGSAARRGSAIQASDDEFEALLARAMESANLGITRRTPRGAIPGGEAEAVHRGGGRYVSVIGSNALFHNPQDRGPETVNLDEIARFTRVFGTVAESLAS